MVENTTQPAYVERTAAGDWRIVGSRVTLESVIAAYWEGQSPEAIHQSYPALPVEQIYGVIAFYLHHRDELDAFLQTQAARWEQFQRDSETRNADLLNRIRSLNSLLNFGPFSTRVISSRRGRLVIVSRQRVGDQSAHLCGRELRWEWDDARPNGSRNCGWPRSRWRPRRGTCSMRG